MLNKFKIINDPVHGFINIPHEILYDVLEHPYFQRLRRIGQTGLLNLIFPGATHTRFHHAMGAMHLMDTALKTLRLKGVEISLEEEKGALLAILLHDVGHGPFSHALENRLMSDWHHERLSLLLMTKLNEEFHGELTTAIQMFRGQYSRKFFNQLISSQLDVDRLDYLKRDSFYTGVSEGNVNTERIISMMNVVEDELVIDEKGIYSIESFLLARMFMYWQVYFHKTAAIAEHLLVKIIERAKYLANQGIEVPAPINLSYFLYKNTFEEASTEDIARFTALDDNDVIQALKLWANHDDKILAYYSTCVIYRKFPKTVLASQPFSEEFIHDKIEEANKMLGIKDGHLVVEQISRSLLPYDATKQPIYLRKKDGTKLLLQEAENQILATNISTKSKKYIFTYPRGL